MLLLYCIFTRIIISIFIDISSIIIIIIIIIIDFIIIIYLIFLLLLSSNDIIINIAFITININRNAKHLSQRREWVLMAYIRIFIELHAPLSDMHNHMVNTYIIIHALSIHIMSILVAYNHCSDLWNTLILSILSIEQVLWNTW